jgi:hypothetical protein
MLSSSSKGMKTKGVLCGLLASAVGVSAITVDFTDQLPAGLTLHDGWSDQDPAPIVFDDGAGKVFSEPVGFSLSGDIWFDDPVRQVRAEGFLNLDPGQSAAVTIVAYKGDDYAFQRTVGAFGDFFQGTWSLWVYHMDHEFDHIRFAVTDEPLYLDRLDYSTETANAVTVPDAGGTAALLALGLLGLFRVKRH